MDIGNCIKNLNDITNYLSQIHQNHRSATFEKMISDSLGHILDLPVYDRDYHLRTTNFIKWYGKDTIPIEKVFEWKIRYYWEML